MSPPVVGKVDVMSLDYGTAVPWYVVDEVACVGDGGYVVNASPAAPVPPVRVEVDAVVDGAGE